MKTNIDTIREAIEGLLEAANHNVGGMVPGVIATWCHQALAALSAIEADAKPQEPCTSDLSVWRFAGEIYENYWHGKNNAATLITAHDDAIRRECADRAEKWFYDTVASQAIIELEGYLMKLRMRQIATLRAAILGTEPARDIKPFSSDEVAVLIHAIGTEPAREES